MPSKNPPTASPRTRAARDRVVQFSIFLRNKVGAFLDVVRLLQEHQINVLGTTVEPSADTAIVRVVVSDPDAVEGIFHLHSIPYSTWPLVVVELKEAAHFGEVLTALLAAEVNIYGAYALLTRPHGHATLALHVEDNECATSVLNGRGFIILNQDDLSR
ncbi:MAG: ACT domain-containing protein [Chthoniobacteraceae bacterium]